MLLVSKSLDNAFYPSCPQLLGLGLKDVQNLLVAQLPSKEDLDQPGFANLPGKEARGQPATQLLSPGLGDVVYLHTPALRVT